MPSKVLNFLIILLLFLAIAQGYAIYKTGAYRVLIESKDTVLVQVSKSFSKTFEEKDVLASPSPDAPEKEKDEYKKLVESQARVESSLEISGCNPSVEVLKVKKSSNLSLKNNDSSDHVLVVNEKYVFPVLPNSEKTITINFDEGPGIYQFACDTTSNIVGIFLVTE